MKTDWQQVRLGDYIEQVENPVLIEANKKYKLLGMSLEGRGLFLREEKIGTEIGAKTLNRLSPNLFIYSRLFAWKGAFDVVSPSFEGMFVSDEYPTFRVDSDAVDVNYLGYYFQKASVWKQVESFCIGVTKGSRNRFKEKYLSGFTIPLPPLAEQQRIVAKLDAVKAKLTEVERLRTQQNRDIRALLFAHYTRLVAGAEWLPLREVAPITRRPVEIDPDATYPELGIRSFGKGTFEKPSMKGSDWTWQKPVWLKAGDLVFSNIKAWEGAVAVVNPEQDGYVGSHRYISCVPDPQRTSAEFLFYYFQTPEGNEKLNLASPGSADRNRTLNTKKLADTLVPVPALAAQAAFLALRERLTYLQAQHTHSAGLLAQVMPSLLAEAFGGA